MATYFKPDTASPNRVVFKIDAMEIHYVRPDGQYGSIPLPASYFTGVPPDGATISYPTGVSDIALFPASALAAMTLALPASPRDGDVVSMSITRGITTFTVNGQGVTVNNAPAAITAGQTVTFKYYASVNQWVRKSLG